jgi:hypothetical protein
VARSKRIGVLRLIAVLGMTACTAPQYHADRLDEHVGRATQEEIAFLLGTPHQARHLEAGGEEWVYRYSQTTMGGPAVVGRRICWEDVLEFDERKILKGKERRKC